MRILVTGGAGFIGSHLAKALLLEGHEVVVLDDLSGGKACNVPTGAIFVEGNIMDVEMLEQLFSQHQFQAVYHLAAYAAEGLSHFIRRFNYQNNLIGSINLINLCVRERVSRFVFTSSIAVYGPNQVPMHESLAPSPEDPYGIAKLAVELDLRAAGEMFSLPYTIYRPHNVYGERQNMGDNYRNVIGIFMRQLKNRQPLTIFGDGSQTRAFSHVSDVVYPMVACLDHDSTIGEIYNVGADEQTTVLRLANLVMEAMGLQNNIVHLEQRREVVHAFADHSHVRNAFPDLPTPVPLKKGLASMAAWALSADVVPTPLPMQVEVEREMPPAWQKLMSGMADE